MKIHIGSKHSLQPIISPSNVYLYGTASFITETVLHDSLNFAELESLGLLPEDVLDFSVNSNPFGPSPLVQEALAKVMLDRYPDRASLILRCTLAERLAVAPEQILIGNGSTELIHLAAQAFLRPGDSALVLGPTINEYAHAAQLAGADVRQWAASPRDDFALNPGEISFKLAERHRVVFICNPNNPTGQCLPAETIQRWAASYPETIFIIDEAYLSFVPGMQSAIYPPAQAQNLLILRSMTKDYALADLRVGYALGPTNLIAALTTQRPTWNVNALSQIAGLAAMQDPTHLARTLTQLRQEKELLVIGLQNLGYHPLPSQTHFFLLPVQNSANFCAILLRESILVCDCASFGLPGYVRIAPRRTTENLCLLEIIEEHFQRKN